MNTDSCPICHCSLINSTDSIAAYIGCVHSVGAYTVRYYGSSETSWHSFRDKTVVIVDNNAKAIVFDGHVIITIDRIKKLLILK